MLSSTQQHRKKRPEKILEMRCFKRKKKMVFLFIFSLFPPSLSPKFWVWWYPAATVCATGADQDKDGGNGVLIGPWSIPSEKGYRNFSLPGELFYWVYLQLSSGMCDKPYILIFLPYSPHGTLLPPKLLQLKAQKASTGWKSLDKY